MSDPIPLSPSFVSISCTAHTSSSSDLDDTPASPKVRFDQDCVLIPDPIPTSRLPRLVTKSYSLPLWKRKQREPSIVSDTEDETNDEHVVFKVSVPSLTIKPRSPSRGDTVHKPLVPCLVHSPQAVAESGSASSSSLSPPRATRPRRASVPPPMQSPDTITVPLRACCSQCYPSIDKCMKEGEHWQVHFSKGAARRRKSVSDAQAPLPRSRHCVRDAMPGFDSIIAVDEVDRRRRSTEIDALTAFTLELPSVSPVASDDFPLRRALSLPDEIHPSRAPLVSSVLPRPRSPAPAIPEEDEQRPTPRRTPVGSPFASTTNLPTTRVVHAVQTTLIQRLTSPSVDAVHSNAILPEKAALETPLPASPALPSLSPEKNSSYFTVPYQQSSTHDRYFTDSPTSSPSSSPRIEHARPSGLGGQQRKRSLISTIPGPATIFRASTQVLKGMSSIGGMPMSA
ncbi:hypothetical protein GY45DRAFT_1347833 [Cubamyces sp. BRFM 1775]|nr:hypothetical protein GY45DRAFT_1347833 [Cubamyces sp. BRFM 1775]